MTTTDKIATELKKVLGDLPPRKEELTGDAEMRDEIIRNIVPRIVPHYPGTEDGDFYSAIGNLTVGLINMDLDGLIAIERALTAVRES